MRGASFRGAVLVVAVAALLVTLLAAGAVGQANQSAADNDSTGPGPYSIEELRTNGNQPSGAPPSTRPYGAYGSFWMRFTPTGLGVSDDDPNDRKYLKPDTTVQRDTVYLGSFRGWESDRTNVTVTVVYWTEGEVERTTSDGQTVTETAAVQQKVETVEVTLAGGDYVTTPIDLQSSYEEPQRVTMWVEGHQGEIQWTFEHQSSRAAQSIPMDDQGSLIGWGVVMLLLPMVATSSAMVWIDRKILEKAGAGPQIGMFGYGLLAFGVFVISAYYMYDSTIEIVTTQPWVLGVGAGLALGLLTVELFGDQTRKSLFLRFDLENAMIHDDGSGIVEADVEEKRLVDLENGETGVVRRGILPFIARARGAIPYLEYRGDPKTRVETTSSSEWEELYLIDPTAEEPIDYEKPSWSIDVLSWPDREEDHPLPSWVPSVDVLPLSIAAAIVVLGRGIGEAWFASGGFGAAIAAVVALLYLASPVDGRAVVELAPAHYDSVVANMLQVSEKFEEVADREYFKQEYYKEKGRNLADRKKKQEAKEQSELEAVLEELTGESADRPGVPSDDD
jgi:hypothetical protein